MKKLMVNQRYLAWEDGEPFFYLGDTAWEMLHKLSREEMDEFLHLRAKQGFTAIQTVALAEFEGVTTPNYYGRLPLEFTDGKPDPTKPDLTAGYSYWDHVDYAVKTAEKYGIFIVLLPTWGDKFHKCWGEGPEIFTQENAEIYGEWLANRYQDSPNIIWMLGGDRPLEPEHRLIVDAMVRGIRAKDKDHLITFHPPGCKDSTDYMADAEHVDFHTSQTGHGIEQCYMTDAIMQKMAKATPKPYMDSEPRYEGHPACFQPALVYHWNEEDVRQNAYWNVLSGTCGHTYGHHDIWSMNRQVNDYFSYTWHDAMNHPGAWQMQYVKQLRLSRDYFSLKPDPELICNNYEGMAHMVSAVGHGYGYVYLPLGLPVTVDLSRIRPAIDHVNCIRALWFDPRTGEETLFSILPADGKTTLVPPTQGKGCDWVLILEGAV